MSIFIDLLRRLLLSCVCLFAVSASVEGQALALDKGQSITTAANRIIHELQHKNFVAFDSEVSSEGLLIVRREPDWSESNVPLKDHPVRYKPQGRTEYLSFNGMRTVVWKEYEVFFAKPDLNNPNYFSLLKQFRGLILESQHNYPRLTTSQETEDGFWFYERRLGPTVSGKIASDECLYIYLKRESGEWKAWRMEFWVRGAFQYNTEKNK